MSQGEELFEAIERHEPEVLVRSLLAQNPGAVKLKRKTMCVLGDWFGGEMPLHVAAHS